MWSIWGRRLRASIALLQRRWRNSVVEAVDHKAVTASIGEECGWTPRYAFMIMMSAGIAVLGLLLSSPAVVIGAMLISPLMNPILGLGFALATFDFSEARRSLTALVLGSILAVAFTGLIVLLSPLKEPTVEILSRTRPSLFDLLVALFAALAGSFAIIKGRGGTIVGVAIATALMPPLAVVGYGLATWNMPVLGGALALFVTNFVTIALSATIMARLYGFGHALSSQQGLIQSLMLAAVFVLLAAPLGVSLHRIASEALTVTNVRSVLGDQFGPRSRVTQLSVDFDAKPLVVRAVVITPLVVSLKNRALQAALEKKLQQPVNLEVDQVLLASAQNSLEAQRARIQASDDAFTAAKTAAAQVANAVGVAAGVPADSVVLDRDHKRATAEAVALPGADLAAYQLLEQRVIAAAPGWQVAITPPLQAMPVIRFDNGSDVLDATAQQAALTSAWAARRWNIPALGVPGLPKGDLGTTVRPTLAQRRALAVAHVLRAQGVQALPAPAAGREFRLSPGG